MVKEAEQNAATDKEKGEKIRIRNEADLYCYQAEKQLAELPESIISENQDLIKEIKEKIEILKETIKTENLNEIRSNLEKLQQKMMEIGKKAYVKNNVVDTKERNSNSGSSTKDDDIIDADFTETK